MDSARFFTSPETLWSMIGSPSAPQIVDVRRRDVYQSAPGIVPGAQWQDANDPALTQALDRHRPVVVVCKAAHEMSQFAAARLRAEAFDASVLAGGYAAWSEARLPFVAKSAVDRLLPQRPSRWITRRRPKIDRIACPWLIRRFIDPQAQFLFVDPPEVHATAHESGAIPFDIEGVELSHEGERCSFDTLLKVFGLENEPSLARLALVVRGADTARPDLAPEAAGLHGISIGLSALAGDDDHGLLERGFMLYDGLFAYLRFASDERHNWPAKAA